MKRKLVALLLLVSMLSAVFMLSACGNQNANDSDENDKENSENNEKPNEPVEKATITYVMYGGTNNESNPTTIHSNDKFPIELATPIKEGYIFAGWFSDGKSINSITSFKPQVLYAMWSKNLDDNALSENEIAESIVTSYQQATFASAEEMFLSDLDKGYLDYTTNGEYTIYVNRYTGVMYYRHNASGQMLSSNSYNFENSQGAVDELSSQIVVSYSTVAASNKDLSLESSKWAAMMGQIDVSRIEGGLRVSYAIGDTATRCLLPVLIEAHTFEKDILRPMFELLYEKMKENLDENPDKTYALDYFDESGMFYNEEDVYKSRYIHQDSIRKFSMKFADSIDSYKEYVQKNVEGGITREIKDKIDEVEDIMNAITGVFYTYRQYNNINESNATSETPEIAIQGYAVYEVKDVRYSMMAPKAALIQRYCPEYSFAKMYEAEKFCGYEYDYFYKPVYECYIEYTFNDDGSFNVKIYPDVISYNEVDFVLKEVKHLQYFDENCVTDDGRIYLPSEISSLD